MKEFNPITLPNYKQVSLQPVSDIKRTDVSILAPIRTSIQRLEDARIQPEIKRLISVIWQTNEIHILFADTGIGKSILAVALADAISKGKSFMFLENDNEPLTVLYYDFELSDKQFLKRYSNDLGLEYPFSNRLFIDTIDFAELYGTCSPSEFTSILFEKFCYDIENLNIEVLVIDNISYLDMNSTQDKNVSLDIMRELCKLKKKYKISILVLAHTPKRHLSSPITINDLAGSKTLSNFADSVSTIGKSSKDNTLRYIKQVKPSRSGEMVYDTENVIVCKIVKIDFFLTFEFIDFESEYEHLKIMTAGEQMIQHEENVEKIKTLKNEGKSIAQIAREVYGKETMKSKVWRILEKIEKAEQLQNE